MSQLVTLNLLGGFEIVTETGVTINTSRSKVRALICFLAMNAPGLQSRQRMCDLLWPHSDLEAGRNSLRQLISLVKKTFPDRQVLTVTNDCIGLNDELWQVDIHQFLKVSSQDSLADVKMAFDLYENNLMEGYEIESPAFDDWLMMERRRLQEKLVCMGVALLTETGSRRSLEVSMVIGRKILSVDPYNELCYQKMLQILIANDQLDWARQLFDELKLVLDTELGVSPNKQTLEVVSVIDGHDTHNEVNLEKSIGRASSNLAQAGRALSRVGSHVEAAQAFQCAIYLYSRSNTKNNQGRFEILMGSHRESLLIGESDNAQKLAMQALEVAESSGDIIAITTAELCLANCDRQGGNLILAQQRAERSQLNAKHIDNSEMLLRANLSLATTKFMLGDYQTAFHGLNENKLILANENIQFTEFWDPGSPTVRTLCWYAWCCSELGRFQLGLTSLGEAMEIAEKEQDNYSILNCRITQGGLYLHQMQYQKGIDLLTDTLLQLEKEEIFVLKPMALVCLALCHVFQRNIETARHLVNSVDKWPAYPIVKAMLGIIYTQLGEYETAKQFASEGQLIASRINAKGDEGWCYLSLATLAYSQNRTLDGDDALTRARSIAREYKMMPLLATCDSL